MLSALSLGRIDGVEQLEHNAPERQLGGLSVQLPGTQDQLDAPIGGAQQCRHRGTDSVHADLDGDGYAGECLLILRLHQPTQVELALVVQVELPVGLAGPQFQV